MKKLIRVTILALFCSLLTAVYLNMVQAADIAPNELYDYIPSVHSR